jgi:hypothetical protein
MLFECTAGNWHQETSQDPNVRPQETFAFPVDKSKFECFLFSEHPKTCDRFHLVYNATIESNEVIKVEPCFISKPNCDQAWFPKIKEQPMPEFFMQEARRLLPEAVAADKKGLCVLPHCPFLITACFKTTPSNDAEDHKFGDVDDIFQCPECTEWLMKGMNHACSGEKTQYCSWCDQQVARGGHRCQERVGKCIACGVFGQIRGPRELFKCDDCHDKSVPQASVDPLHQCS